MEHIHKGAPEVITCPPVRTEKIDPAGEPSLMEMARFRSAYYAGKCTIRIEGKEMKLKPKWG